MPLATVVRPPLHLEVATIFIKLHTAALKVQLEFVGG